MSNNIDAENRFAELVAFIGNKAGEHEMSNIRETLIEDNLGVTGGDADDSIIAFSKKYGIDISSFSFAKYFNDEASMFDASRTVKPFNVGHLEKH